MIVLLEWDMGMGSGVSVLVGKTRIDDVDLVALKVCTDQKIGRLYLKPHVKFDKLTYHLVCQKQDGFQAELAVAVIKDPRDLPERV